MTGAPNRRSWDHELSRACAHARDTDEPLAVAILDLDHFKRYNDAHGHPAGDLLLREAVAAWTALLDDGQVLARYGGEEFAVLLPGLDLASARLLLDGLRAVTPVGQTFSAGLTLWDPAGDPAATISRADEALYQAKRLGRDRVVVWADSAQAVSEASGYLRVVVQPLVDAATGAVVGHEALTRFAGPGDVREQFLQAHAGGYGDLLEAHAVTNALDLPDRPAGRLLFVNVSAAALRSQRFWELLPPRLDDVVVEPRRGRPHHRLGRVHRRRRAGCASAGRSSRSTTSVPVPATWPGCSPSGPTW
nr:diguanylate cyclase [Angustibacter aerolatus]